MNALIARRQLVTEGTLIPADSAIHTFISISATFLTGGNRLSLGMYTFACWHGVPNLIELLRDFQEALKVTSEVKKRFSEQYDDLISRGDRLIRESAEAGVTSMRAHVEVDTIVGDTCLKAGLALKEKWKEICDIQICSEQHRSHSEVTDNSVR